MSTVYIPHLCLGSRAKASTLQGRHRSFVGDSASLASFRGTPVLGLVDTADVILTCNICMAINVSVQCNGGFLLDIKLLTLFHYHHRGTRLKCHEELLFLQPLFPPTKCLNRFPPDGVDAQNHRGLDAFRVFFKQVQCFILHNSMSYTVYTY